MEQLATKTFTTTSTPLGGWLTRWVMLLGTVLFMVGTAHATPEEDRVRAEKLIQEGLKFARGKQFREAIPKFEEALKLYPHPETQHNLARAHEELGELIKAYDYFTQALKSDYAFAADGRQRLTRIESELRKSYARLTVRTTPSQMTVVLTFPSGEEETHISSPFQSWVPAGRTHVIGSNPSFKTGEQTLDLAAGEDRELSVVLLPLPKRGFLQLSVNMPGASVALSGQAVGTSPLEGMAWEAGAYQLEVKLKGYKTHREQIVINEDQVTSVNVTLLPLGDGGPDEGVPSWIGWTLVGTGAAAGAVAAYLQFGKARPLSNDAAALPDSEVDEYNRLQDKASDFQLAAQVTTVFAVALVGTGAYLLIFEQGDDSTASAPRFLPSVAVTPDGGHVGAALRF